MFLAGFLGEWNHHVPFDLWLEVCAKFLAISFLFLSLLSFRAMLLIDSEGVVVAREVSLCISLMITFLTPIHAKRCQK